MPPGPVVDGPGVQPVHLDRAWAWTPATSSASVMAATLAFSGKADSGGGSIKTDVATIPRARRGSGARSWILIDQFVNILSEPGRIDSRGRQPARPAASQPALPRGVGRA